MGLFSFIKNINQDKPKDYPRLLKPFGFYFDNIQNLDLEEMELNIDDEVLGGTKKSFGKINSEYFESIFLLQKKDKSINSVLTCYNCDEKKLRDIVNKLNTELGEDSLWNKDFDMNDINRIRGYNSDHANTDPIREWNTFYKNNMHYKISLAYDINVKEAWIAIISCETIHFYQDKPKVPTEGYK